MSLKMIPCRLKREREAKGISKSELARGAGMAPGDIGSIESGRLVPYEAQMEKIAKAIGWEGKVTDLFEDDDHE